MIGALLDGRWKRWKRVCSVEKYSTKRLHPSRHTGRSLRSAVQRQSVREIHSGAHSPRHVLEGLGSASLSERSSSGRHWDLGGEKGIRLTGRQRTHTPAAQVEAENAEAISEKYEVSSVPFFLFFKVRKDLNTRSKGRPAETQRAGPFDAARRRSMHACFRLTPASSARAGSGRRPGAAGGG